MFHTVAQDPKNFQTKVVRRPKATLFIISYQDSDAESQAEWFCKNTGEGLTQAGLSRINQSIEAFVYCVLGAQMNVRSSILGSGGRAKEAQSEFCLSGRRDKATGPGGVCSKIPGRLVINTESVVGYNNQLKQAGAGMKLGIKNQVNTSTKKRPFNTWQEENQR